MLIIVLLLIFVGLPKEISNCKTLGGGRGGEGVKQDLIF
jgi:hypothetical protein